MIVAAGRGGKTRRTMKDKPRFNLLYVLPVVLLGALLVSVRPRHIKLTAPVSVAAWGIGFGWLIADTMA
mgnify:CR=1 FL=1